MSIGDHHMCIMASAFDADAATMQQIDGIKSTVCVWGGGDQHSVPRPLSLATFCGRAREGGGVGNGGCLCVCVVFNVASRVYLRVYLSTN